LTKVFLFSESIAQDWFLTSFSIRQLKQAAILLNFGLPPVEKIWHSTFPEGIPHGAIFGVRYFLPLPQRLEALNNKAWGSFTEKYSAKGKNVHTR
jgi:hypothetical protein